MKEAEIKLLEPAPDNAGEGKRIYLSNGRFLHV